MGGLVNPFLGGSGSFVVTNGSGTFLVDIPGAPFTITEYGYQGDAGSGLTPATFGSILPTTWNGFPIIGLYWTDVSERTTLALTGDASALAPVLLAAGVDQLLGAGSYYSGVTTFQSTSGVANQFGGASTVVNIS